MTVLEKAKIRLKMFKIEVPESDNEILIFLKDKSLNNINNITGQNYNEENFPNSILDIWMDKIVGEYIKLKKITKELPESYNLDMMVTQIKEGDTNITFSGKSEEEKLEITINYLLAGRNSELIRYRRLAW